MDVDEQALQAVQERFGCPIFNDLADALKGIEADGVLIASPSLLHGKHIVQALEAGFAVMVEKPLAASLSEAVEVVRRARQLGRPLMVAENYRFFQAERTLRRALDQELVGELRSAVCIDRRCQPSDTQGAWVKNMAQPFLTEISVHHFDSFRYLFARQPVSLWTRTYNPPGSDYDQNGAAEALIEMEGRLSVQYSGSFVGSRYEYSLWIEGERGELRTDRSRVWCRRIGERQFRRLDGVDMPEGESLRYPDAGMVAMLAQFREAIMQGTEPETSGRDNLWTLAMFEAALQSSDHGRFVAMTDVFTPEMRDLITEARRILSESGLGVGCPDDDTDADTDDDKQPRSEG